MAGKKIIGNLKLRIPGGRAPAGPPVGSTLGQWGLNMMDFINPFNEKTKDLMGKNVIVHIKVYEDLDKVIPILAGYRPSSCQVVEILYGRR